MKTLITMCLATSLTSFGQAQETPESTPEPTKMQQAADMTFEKLDDNDDGQLDEAEMMDISAEELEHLRINGLAKTFPVSRSDFLAASTTKAQAEGMPTEKEGDKSANTKPENSKPAVTTASTPPGVTRPGRKNRLVPELPPEYAARDKNGDGQIGMYEWDRKKLAEFVKLDKNGDGFLTPVELMTKEMLKTFYMRATNREEKPGAGTATPGAPAAAATTGADNSPKKPESEAEARSPQRQGRRN